MLVVFVLLLCVFFFFKHKTAYEMRISDWSSDVCSSDLETHALFDDGPSHLHYLMAFAAGWLLRVRPALFESVARCWKGAAVLALLAFLPIAWTEWTWPGDTRAPGWAIILFHVARQVQGWAAIVALVGVADRWGNRDHPKRAMLAEETRRAHV